MCTSLGVSLAGRCRLLRRCGPTGQPLRVTGGGSSWRCSASALDPGRPSSATKPDGAALAFAGMLRSMAARVKGSCKFHHRDVRLFSDMPAKLASSWNSMAAYRNHPAHSMAGSRHRLDRDVASASVRGACDLRRGSLNGHPGFRTPTCARPFLSNNDAMPSYTEEP